MLLEELTNTALNTDAYKTSQYLQLPSNTRYLSSYIESRGGKYDDVVSFGLQAFVKEYMMTPMTMERIDRAEETIRDDLNMPFNRAGWEYIVKKHNGYMPVEIQAVPEGMVMPNKNVVAQIVNTDPKCAWVTNYLETALLRATWFPTAVATRSWSIKQMITRHMEKTCDNLDGLPYKLNDFGARSATSNESAAIGGMAHLLNFAGSDTVMGVHAAKIFYNYKGEKQGVPASEHSTITSWGREHEADAYRNMIKQFGGKNPDGSPKILAVVSDSYNLWNALENIWGDELKDDVVNNGALVVVRPDSGNPVDVVCQSVDILAEKFGTTINTKGYKVLPPYIRLIQGDGVSEESIDAILTAMEERGYSADNVNFGMGSELLQKLDRDTQRMAMKANAIMIAELEPVTSDFILSVYDLPGEWRDVYKDPITDPGKISKKGAQATVWDDQTGYFSCRRDQLNGRIDLLQPIYRKTLQDEKGVLLNEVTMAQARQNNADMTKRLSDFKHRPPSYAMTV